LISTVVIAKCKPNFDTLGFELCGQPGENYSLCYVDTERNLTEQFPYAIQQIKVRAGYSREEHPDNFDYISLKNVPREQRFDVLNDYLSYVREKQKGHILIVLDQMADLVKDFKSVEESLNLCDMINVMIDEQNVTFLGIIHENPGAGQKARGHLGTEAGNKATTILQVGYAPTSQGVRDDLVQLRYIKRRMGSPNLTFFARYDEVAKGLVTVDNDMVASSVAKGQRDLMNEKRQLILSLLGDTLREQELNTKQISDLLNKQGVKNTRGIALLLTQIANERTVFSDSANRGYRLKTKQDGLATVLSLESVEPALKVA
jgi:hypothetical protein